MACVYPRTTASDTLFRQLERVGGCRVVTVGCIYLQESSSMLVLLGVERQISDLACFMRDPTFLFRLHFLLSLSWRLMRGNDGSHGCIRSRYCRLLDALLALQKCLFMDKLHRYRNQSRGGTSVFRRQPSEGHGVAWESSRRSTSLHLFFSGPVRDFMHYPRAVKPA
jgi:hypothetical protein